MARSSATWKKGGPSPNPKGRAPGPTAPTLLLKEAFLRAANRAGGGGDKGLDNYLTSVALSHPQVFVPALSKIIPFQVDVNATKIIVEVIRRFEPLPLTIEHKKPNGHAINGNGKPPASE